MPKKRRQIQLSEVNRMTDFTINEMQEMQKLLQEKYKDKWRPISPAIGRDKLLWMMAEMGEVADIIKKQGDDTIISDPSVREHFIEELCDTLMYFNDVCRCYSITPEELEKVYLAKHKKNLGRW